MAGPVRNIPRSIIPWRRAVPELLVAGLLIRDAPLSFPWLVWAASCSIEQVLLSRFESIHTATGFLSRISLDSGFRIRNTSIPPSQQRVMTAEPWKSFPKLRANSATQNHSSTLEYSCAQHSSLTIARHTFSLPCKTSWVADTRCQDI